MKVLVTGGAGFIGRWVVKELLGRGDQVWVLDNLASGSETNLAEFRRHPFFKEFVIGDIKDTRLLTGLFREGFAICFHLAAQINVQHSIDRPQEAFSNDVVGTFNLLEECRKNRTKMVFMSTCMVYDAARADRAIDESWAVKPASPYSGAKLAGENLVLSYYHAYSLPAVILRPFNTYGPYQKSSGEGGVIAVFIRRQLEGAALSIYGDGAQTRDFLFASDCARFIVGAGASAEAGGLILNAGSGQDLTINELARLICDDGSRICHVPHIHPQSEIPKLQCDHTRARALLGWEPGISLRQGIALTEAWIREQMANE
ncbi:MAG: NAD-dependent epimerase/dehydratase family protein [Thermacetogeniaceae bacterium]